MLCFVMINNVLLTFCVFEGVQRKKGQYKYVFGRTKMSSHYVTASKWSLIRKAEVPEAKVSFALYYGKKAQFMNGPSSVYAAMFVLLVF